MQRSETNIPSDVHARESVIGEPFSWLPQLCLRMALLVSIEGIEALLLFVGWDRPCYKIAADKV